MQKNPNDITQRKKCNNLTATRAITVLDYKSTFKKILKLEQEIALLHCSSKNSRSHNQHHRLTAKVGKENGELFQVSSAFKEGI